MKSSNSNKKKVIKTIKVNLDECFIVVDYNPEINNEIQIRCFKKTENEPASTDIKILATWISTLSKSMI